MNYAKNTRFENKDNLIREEKAMKKWINGSGTTYKKLGMHDVDFIAFSNKSKTYAYVEVKGRHRNVADAYPLPIAARKLVKIYDSMNKNPKATKSFIIWACDDGIIVGDMENMIGEAKAGGRKSRDGSSNDWEVMVYYDKQSVFNSLMY